MPDDNDDQAPDEDYVPRSQIRDLEDKAKRATEAEAETAQLRRELAFAQALGPSADPKLSYFRKGYDGDLTPEAIREAAKRDGFLTEQPPAPALDQGDLTAHARVAAASTGVTNTGFDWQAELAATDPNDRDKILEIVERAGGYTSRMNQ